MSWSLRKKKQGIFCTVYFVRRNFFSICVLFQYIVQSIHFQTYFTFKITSYFFACFLKLSKAFSVSLSLIHMRESFWKACEYEMNLLSSLRKNFVFVNCLTKVLFRALRTCCLRTKKFILKRSFVRRLQRKEEKICF